MGEKLFDREWYQAQATIVDLEIILFGNGRMGPGHGLLSVACVTGRMKNIQA